MPGRSWRPRESARGPDPAAGGPLIRAGAARDEGCVSGRARRPQRRDRPRPHIARAAGTGGRRRGISMRARLFTDENRKWWTLVAVSFGLFMIMLDNTVVNV